MEARNRKLHDWYGKIERGEIKLPRFQRFEAWDWRRITSLMNTIIDDLPLGITLVLEVGDREQFVSRYLATAPQTNSRVLEHLLDGQQRLTAVWRVLHNNYELHSFFVYLPRFDETQRNGEEGRTIFCRGRYYRKNGLKYPLWCDNPGESLKRGMIPTDLLRPEDIQDEIDKWINEATESRKPSDAEKFEEFFDWKKSISDEIKDLRSTIRNYNLPYLSLSVDTSKTVALDVFINMNTNSKPLTTYDIIVAEVESELGKSLHDKQTQLLADYPAVERYDEISRLILNTSALLQNKMPNQKGAWDMDKREMVARWDVMADGLNQMANFLAGEGIYDDTRLPTNAVLWVIAALYDVIPDAGDQRGWCEKIMRKYMWRGFLTSRYDNSAPTHAYYDYLGLKRVLLSGLNGDEVDEGKVVPIFNEAEYEIPSANELGVAGWPKSATILGRAVLAISLKLGALDFATEERVSIQNIDERQYHHVFPDSLLKEAGIEDSFIAMNCALIKDKTNLNIGRKEPLKYLKERYKWADEATVEYRLNSHLIPIDELANGGYEHLSDEDRHEKVRQDYGTFVEARAMLMAIAASHLCNGKPISAKEIIQEAKHTATH
jgi:hypothetical protein